LRAYQPAEQRYIISVPELPGCQAELHTSGLPDLEAWEQSIQKGAEAIDRWIAAAWAAATQDDHVSVPVVSLPKTLEEPPEEPLTHLKEVGLIPIETEADYKLAVAVLYALVDRTGCDPTHPLDEVLAALTDQVEAYEDVHHPI
ncbi:MAG TPA: hypothetical protein VFU32_01425, partial [Ktedonobacterales bacterium]|nr:hypothetical protein [Ktedonobacterales bacterium]